MAKSNTFSTVQRMVRAHLKDADKGLGGIGNPGPTPGESYAAAFATATGAYASGKGITVQEWSELHDEIRSHRESSV